jgi:kynurenine formamidase
MSRRPPLSRQQVADFHRSLSNHGRWGERDQLGALNLIRPEKRAAAAARVRSGRSVSCARLLPTAPAADNPNPAQHHMTGTHGEGFGADWFGIAPHGMATSHIDALCHIFHEGRLYNGYPSQRVTAHGAQELGIQALRSGVVSRGVLLDLPRSRGVDWLEKGEPIYVDDLERAERDAGVRVEEGDLLLVATGRWALREAEGPWVPAEGLAGLDASCLAWLHERGVAALGCDGVSDVLPSRVDGFPIPIHSVAIAAMGLHLLDNLELRDLCAACVEEGRADFLLVIAPLVLQGGTASPVNPIALF